MLFLGLSFKEVPVKALSFLKIIKISHVSIWHWIQKYKPRKYFKNKKIQEYVIDETAIKAGILNAIHEPAVIAVLINYVFYEFYL